MSGARRWRSALGSLLAGALAAGCGYSTGLGLAPGYSSIGIEIFGNDTPVRDLEREVHAAITRSTRNLVNAAVLPPGTAELVMRGKIRDYRRRGGVRSAENVQLESGIILTVDVTLWDRRRGVQIAGPVVDTVHVGYTQDLPANEREARRRAVANMADRVVLELVARASATGGAEGVGESREAAEGN